LLNTLLSPFVFLARSILLRPLPFLLLLCGLALANLWRRRVESRRRLLLLTIPFVMLVIATIPAAVHPVLGSLEWPYPPLSGRPADAEAIVVLSGGIKPPDTIRTQAEPSDPTMNRCLLAAEIYHRGRHCPVIVSGGRYDPDPTYPPDSALMRKMLIRLGVDEADVIEEDQSRNTIQNALATREILRDRGIGKVLLVTNAFHMRRSLLTFRKLGIDAVAAPCDHLATGSVWKLGNFIPSPEAMGNLTAALHEWIGLVWYRVRGRI